MLYKPEIETGKPKINNWTYMDEIWNLPEEGSEGYIENESTGYVLGTSEGNNSHIGNLFLALDQKNVTGWNISVENGQWSSTDQTNQTNQLNFENVYSKCGPTWYG